jgi:hypothetical protein
VPCAAFTWTTAPPAPPCRRSWPRCGRSWRRCTATPLPCTAWALRRSGSWRTPRQAVAEALGAEPSEVVFTSGGTEANNLAVFGTVWARQKPHVVVSALRALLGPGTRPPPSGTGRPRGLLSRGRGGGSCGWTPWRSSLRPNTALVSVVLVNNEVGTLQPLLEVAKVLDEAESRWGRRPLLHTDAVQALGARALPGPPPAGGPGHGFRPQAGRSQGHGGPVRTARRAATPRNPGRGTRSGGCGVALRTCPARQGLPPRRASGRGRGERLRAHLRALAGQLRAGLEGLARAALEHPPPRPSGLLPTS